MVQKRPSFTAGIVTAGTLIAALLAAGCGGTGGAIADQVPAAPSGETTAPTGTGTPTAETPSSEPDGGDTSAATPDQSTDPSSEQDSGGTTDTTTSGGTTGTTPDGTAGSGEETAAGDTGTATEEPQAPESDSGTSPPTTAEPIVIEGSAPLDISSLPLNEWVQVTPGMTFAAGVPSDLVVRSGARSYGTAVLRTTDGTVVYYEGVSNADRRQDYYADALASWDMDQNHVTIDKVSHWGGSLYSHGILLDAFHDDPTPSPRHTYETFTYLSGYDQIVLTHGANWKLGGDSAPQESKDALALDNNSTWFYDYSSNSWERRSGNPRLAWNGDISPYEGHLVHWPSVDRLLYLDKDGRKAAEYNIATNEWTRATPTNRPPDIEGAGASLYGAMSTWDSRRSRWVFRNNVSQVFYYDPATHTFVDLPNPSGLTGGIDITYLPDHDLYLVAGETGSETKIFDPSTDQWQSINAGPIRFHSGTNDEYLVYDPNTGLAGIVAQEGAHYVMRFQRP